MPNAALVGSLMITAVPSLVDSLCLQINALNDAEVARIDPKHGEIVVVAEVQDHPSFSLLHHTIASLEGALQVNTLFHHQQPVTMDTAAPI